MISIRVRTSGVSVINLRLGDVGLIHLPETRQLGSRGADVAEFEQRLPRKLMLQHQVVMLRVRCPQLLLGDGQHGKSGGRERVGPSRECIEVVRQERRIQHDVPRNISDNRFVERAIARAHNGLAVAEHIPRQADTRRDVVVIRIVNSIHVRLGHHTGGAQGVQVASGWWGRWDPDRW